MVELCSSRINILQLDEATLLEEAKNINMEKIRLSIKQVSGFFFSSFYFTDKKWVTSWENLILPYANNKSADQPAHPGSLIRAFVFFTAWIVQYLYLLQPKFQDSS